MQTYAQAMPIPLPAAAQQQPATITLQRALVTGASPDVLRAVAKWNERKSFDERRRKSRLRMKTQAVALREVADELEMHDIGMEVALSYPRCA